MDVCVYACVFVCVLFTRKIGTNSKMSLIQKFPYLPLRIRGKQQLFALPNPQPLNLRPPRPSKESHDGKSLAFHRLESLEHPTNQAFRLKHDAQILRVAILRQPDGVFLGVEMFVEIGQDGRVQILRLVDRLEDLQRKGGRPGRRRRFVRRVETMMTMTRRRRRQLLMRLMA